MDTLLFFVLPIVTVILAIVLQKLLKCPILVAATFFAVYLILAFTVFDTSFLIFAIIYTILAFITAFIFQLICEIINRIRQCCGCENNCSNILRCGCNLGRDDENCNCNNTESNSQNVILNAEFTPNSNNNGTTGCFRGNYRRRYY